MSLMRTREFLLGVYHDLPNVLFIGSLVLGSITGYLPLVWMSLGLILNGAIVSLGQGLLSMLFPTWNQVKVAAGSAICEIISSHTKPFMNGNATVVAPSHWLAAAAFFAVFSIYNSIRIGTRDAVPGANQDKVNNRQAFSLTVLTVGLVFFALIMARGFSGCETWLGGVLGVVFGGGLAIGYWHLLDACGTGMVPDILQVVQSMPPPGRDGQENVPVICTPPPSE
jgi:hypothetical protein